MRPILVFLMLLTSVAAHAQVYKCVGPDGKAAFSDKACAPTTRGAQVDVRPNSIDTSGAREQALKQENARLREEVAAERARVQVPAGPVVGRTRADLEAEKSSSRECALAKRDYEFASSSIANKGDEIGSAKRRMYSACGMREPDTIIIHTGNITHCIGGLCYGSSGRTYPRRGGCVPGVPVQACQ